MPELIDKAKLLEYLAAIKPDEYVSAYGEAAVDVINHVEEYVNEMSTIHDIDRAAILRLCNEIEDIVSEISKLSENYLIYSDCKSILDRTKAIGKEISKDAGIDD